MKQSAKQVGKDAGATLESTKDAVKDLLKKSWCGALKVPALIGASRVRFARDRIHTAGHYRSVVPHAQPWPRRAPERQVSGAEIGAVLDLTRPNPALGEPLRIFPAGPRWMTGFLRPT